MPTKVMLMPLLCLLYWLCAARPMALVAMGLLFGCAGDALLLSEDGSPLFVLGMLAFALGHICYMAAMASHFGFALLTPLRAGAMALGYALYLAAFFTRVRPYVSTKLLLGATGYMLFLCGTSACALLCLLRVPSIATALLFAGSLFFIFSDTILAWTVCLRREDRTHAVMLTYIMAQALIAAAFAI